MFKVNFLRDTSAIFSIISAIVLPVLLGLCGISLTVGNAAIRKSESQSAADLAALSASATYRENIVNGMSKARAQDEAKQTMNRVFAINKNQGGSLNHKTDNTADFITDDTIEITYSEDAEVFFGKLVNFNQDNLVINTVARANTSFTSPLINVKAIELLRAADRGDDVTPLLNGLEISGSSDTQTEKVFDNDTALRYFDADCKRSRAIGFNSEARGDSCSIYNDYDEILNISLQKQNQSFKSIEIIVADVHYHPSISRNESIGFSVFSDSNIKIGDFIADSRGDIDKTSGDLSITAQPLSNSGRAVSFNRKTSNNIGLMKITITSKSNKPIKFIQLTSTTASFELVEINAITENKKPVALVK